MSDSEKIFLVIGAVGFLLLLVSFIFGEIEHELEISGEADHDLGSDGYDPSMFSMKVITASMVGFGAFGYGASSYGLPDIVSWPLALIGFVGTGAFTFYLVLKPLAKLQWNTSSSRDSYRGLEAKVTLAITSQRKGAVSFRDHNGTFVELQAELAEGDTVPVGASVFIVDVTPQGVTVMPNPTNLIEE